jgi:hypothetical protein
MPGVPRRKRCVQKDSMYDWLMDTVSVGPNILFFLCTSLPSSLSQQADYRMTRSAQSIPDPVEPVAKEKKPRAPRAKKAKAEGVEGEDGGDDKPKPKRRKKAAPAAAAEEEEEEKGTMEAVVEPTKPAGEDDDEYDE